MNERRLPWDDLRTVLVVARAGSLAGAARTMGVSHATVFRRLAAVETRLGARLFERGAGGYAPTPVGEEVAEAAARVEREIADVQRRVLGQDLKPAGTVRLTTTDTLLAGLLTPVLAQFQQHYPDIALEVAVSNALFSLPRREADVAIRPTRSPPEHLVGRRIGRISHAVYGAAQHFAPGEPVPALERLDWVGPDETLWYRQLEQWMRARELPCRYRVDTLAGIHAAVRSGIGVAVLPCYLGEGDQGLVRLGERLAELASALWILTHRDLRRSGRIRALMDWVGTAVRHQQHRLDGVVPLA